MAGYNVNHPPKNVYTRDWRLGTRVEFDENTASNHIVFSPAADKRVRLLGGRRIVEGAVTLQWTDESGDISGDFVFAGAGGWEAFLPFQQYETGTAGADLRLNLGGAVQVAGDIWYEVID